MPADRVLHPVPTPEQRLVAISEPNSQGAEMFRVLATRLAHMQNKRRLQKLLITSSVVDEGKSVVAVNLALTLARRPDTRVLLIEADLRRPTASALLSNSPLRGISEWCEGKLAMEDSLYQVRDLPLWFLPAGRPMNEPLPLLESDKFRQDAGGGVRQLRLGACWMPHLCCPWRIPPRWRGLCDGVLVVVREGDTRKKVLNKAVDSIDRAKLLGVVFNEASTLNLDYDKLLRRQSLGREVEEGSEGSEEASQERR